MLLRIWHDSFSRDEGSYSAVDIPRLKPPEVGAQRCQKAIEMLLDFGLLDGHMGSFEISAKGIDYVETWLDDPSSKLSELRDRIYGPTTSQGAARSGGSTVSSRGYGSGAYGAGPYGSAPLGGGPLAGGPLGGAPLGGVPLGGSPVVGPPRSAVPPGPQERASRIAPASDRVVTLDHNAPTYAEAMDALDAAVAAFKADHHLGNEFGAEKRALLATLEAGRGLLEATQVHVSAVVTTIINPLQNLVTRYEDAIVAGLVTAGVDQLIGFAKTAITLVLQLIGHS